MNPVAPLAAAGLVAGGVLFAAGPTGATSDAPQRAPLPPPCSGFTPAALNSAAVPFAAPMFHAAAMVAQTSGLRLPNEPRKQFGASVTGAFEGWFYTADGSRSFLVGYLNRNTSQELDIAIGPDNRIEPGGPDLGQPTHFLPGRVHGVFTVPVPKEFTPQDRYTWTIVANNQSTSIPLRLNADYIVNPFSEIAVKNTPPVVRFEQSGPAFQGPIANPAKAVVRTASVASPLVLSIWAADDMKYTSGTSAPLSASRPPVTLTWSKYRGPGSVTFDKAKPVVERQQGPETAGSNDPGFSGRATTRVTFGAPGEYLLHVSANDYSGEGGGGFVCCWTTAMVRVVVH